MTQIGDRLKVKIIHPLLRLLLRAGSRKWPKPSRLPRRSVFDARVSCLSWVVHTYRRLPFAAGETSVSEGVTELETSVSGVKKRVLKLY